jgi:predicted Fe-Mo cluster-binding NifX family protein/predicted DNA-binding protein (UPF0251 family)
MEVYLPLEGYEAIRLADYEGLKHTQAAERMKVSRQTYGRILARARRRVADVLVNGHALCIDGGHFIERERQREDIASSDVEIKTAATKRPSGKEEKMSKVAISSEGPTLDDALDPRFGRAAGFVIVDPETLEFKYLDNGASQTMAQGAGIQAAEIVARAGAGVLLTGFVGPKAFQALSAAGVKIAQNLENMTVRQALEAYKNNEVEMASQPNRRGHWR